MERLFDADNDIVIRKKIYMLIDGKRGVPHEYRLAISACPNRHFPSSLRENDTYSITSYYAIYEIQREITGNLFEYEFVGMDHSGRVG